MGSGESKIILIDSDPMASGDPNLLTGFCDAIRHDGVIIFPTETSYLLGADGLNSNAINRLIELKNRPTRMPLSMAFPDIGSASEWTLWDSRARLIADRFLPGPLTMILPRKTRPEILYGVPDDNVGIRIPGYPLLIELLKRLNRPLTATSANPHGSPEPFSINQCVHGADRILDVGMLPIRKPSTIISLCSDELICVREGSISFQEILETLR